MSARRRRVVGGVLVALPVAAWLAWWGWAQLRWRAALRAWEAERGPLEDVLLRFPDAGPNQTALELERAAAALGIGLAPRGSPRSPQDGDLPRELRREMSDYLEAETASASPGLTAPPPHVEDFIEEHAEELDAIVALLASGRRPRWDLTTPLMRSGWGPTPNLAGHVDLQRILCTAGLRDLQRGRPERAGRLARASVTLGDALASRPEAIALLVHRNCARMRHPLIRGLPADIDVVLDSSRSLRAAVRAAAEAEVSFVARRHADAAMIVEMYASKEPQGNPLVRARQAGRGFVAAPRMRRDAGALVSHWRAVLSSDEALGSCAAMPTTTPVTTSPLPCLLEHLHGALQVAAVGDFDEEMTRVILDARRRREPGIVPGACSRWSFAVELLGDGRLQVTTLGSPPRQLPGDRRPPVATTWLEPWR